MRILKERKSLFKESQIRQDELLQNTFNSSSFNLESALSRTLPLIDSECQTVKGQSVQCKRS